MLIKLEKGLHSNVIEVGGKGFSLLKLFSAGYLVPDGGIVPSNYFINALKENNIFNKIVDICSETNASNIQEKSIILQKIILQCNISIDISEFVQDLEEFVVVRSSAISEDSNDNSFAGIHDSFLNIEKKDIIQNIKKVWASLFCDRALHYRLRKGLPLFDGMAVVVQNMVNAKCAGVVYTMHPIEPELILIEVVSGLGNNLMNGVITPNAYLFSRQTLALVSSQVFHDALLDMKMLKRLVIKSMEIEKLCGYPQEIEWAFGDDLYFLQTRKAIISTIDSRILEIEKVNRWTIFIKRKSPPLWHSLTDKGLTRESLIKYTGMDIFISIRREEIDNWLNIEESQNVRNMLTRVVKKDVNFLNNVYAKCMEICIDYINFCIDNSTHNYEKLSLEVITDIFKKYIDKNIPTAAFRPFIFILDSIVITLIEEEISRIRNSGVEIDFQYEYITPIIELPFVEMEKSMLSIGAIMERDGLIFSNEIIEKLITEHLKKYSWIGTHRFFGEPITKDNVIENIERKLGSCEQQIKDNFRENEKRKIKLDEIKVVNSIINNLLQIAQKYAYLRTYRMDVVIEGDFYLRPLLEEISKRLRITYDDLIYLRYSEILNLLSGCNFDFGTKVKLRKEYFVTYLVNGNEMLIFEGNDNRCNIDNDVEINTDVIKGVVAQKGKVRGKVKIIKSKEEIGKLENGNIIVSPMTTPEMVVGLFKCAGIVTDEGGIACHAAQISRELKIPCIIGTNNATKILKDGDVIEVIAEGLNGEVRFY